MADSLGYNKNYICHLFQKHIGQTYVQYLTQRRLDTWVHNKTIQKCVESFRLTEETKETLKTLKIRN